MAPRPLQGRPFSGLLRIFLIEKNYLKFLVADIPPQYIVAIHIYLYHNIRTFNPLDLYHNIRTILSEAAPWLPPKEKKTFSNFDASCLLENALFEAISVTQALSETNIHRLTANLTVLIEFLVSFFSFCDIIFFRLGHNLSAFSSYSFLSFQ